MNKKSKREAIYEDLLVRLGSSQESWRPPLNSRQAQEYLNMSESTLVRHTFPNDPEGPRSFQYKAGGNRYYHQSELDSYIQRRMAADETNARASLHSRSLVSDLMDF